MEKRYFTSAMDILSYASLTFWIGMTSTSAVMLCLPQKYSISCVSAILPMGEPERLQRLNIRLKAATASIAHCSSSRVYLLVYFLNQVISRYWFLKK